jgi:hypothetical protein
MAADVRNAMQNAIQAMKNAKRHKSSLLHFSLPVLHFAFSPIAFSLLSTALLAALSGCADNSPKGPSGADRAQGDPMNYGPHYGRADIAPKPDNSNDRGGFKRELNDFLNP